MRRVPIHNISYGLDNNERVGYVVSFDMIRLFYGIWTLPNPKQPSVQTSDVCHVTYCKLSPSTGTSSGGGGRFGSFCLMSSIEMRIKIKNPDKAAAWIVNDERKRSTARMHSPTDLRMLSHLTSSIIVRKSPSVTRDLFRTLCSMKNR